MTVEFDESEWDLPDDKTFGLVAYRAPYEAFVIPAWTEERDRKAGR